MSRLELIELQHEVRRQGIKIGQQIALHAVNSRFELTREIIKLRHEIAELKLELYRVRPVSS